MIKKCKTDRLLDQLNAKKGLLYPQVGYSYFADIKGGDGFYNHRSVYTIISEGGGVVYSSMNSADPIKRCRLIQAEIDAIPGPEVEITRVIFRTFKGKDGGDVIALFPDDIEGPGVIGSYMHVGQHSGACRSIIGDTRPATDDEIEPLRRELESTPYHYRFELLERMPRR